MKKWGPTLLTIGLLSSSLWAQSSAEPMDTQLFLDPFVCEQMGEIANATILDVGARASHLMTKNINKGLHLYQSVPKKKDLELLTKELAFGGIERELLQAPAHTLPFEDAFFDCALSLNNGEKLGCSTAIQDQETLVGHIKEMARVMKPGGRLVMSAPASYATVFTDGIDGETAEDEINNALSQLGTLASDEEICSTLKDLEHINRATFVVREDELKLVTDQLSLKLGEKIWRKEHQEVFSSFYHSEEEYLIAFKMAGLKCEEIARPSFFGKVKYKLYHQNKKEEQPNLGEGYIRENPFTLYSVVKPA